jgi:hypothetical protein
MERSKVEAVRFLRPFRVPGVDRVLAPGTYEVETIEEQIDGLSFIAYRRVSTTIMLHDPGGRTRQVIEIDPEDLTAALNKDAEASDGLPQV